jgi:dephospho-CoA kinase
MKLFCLTGGIACGKSTVLNRLKGRPDIVTIEYDHIARKLLEEADPKVIGEILQAHVATNGKLDRRKFLSALFADRERKNQPERHLARPAWRKIEEQLRGIPGTSLVVVEAAIVFEAEIDHKFDAVIAATCSDKTQLRRLIRREGMSRAAAKKRIESQMPNAEKNARADLAIDTELAPEEFEDEVDVIYYALREW